MIKKNFQENKKTVKQIRQTGDIISGFKVICKTLNESQPPLVRERKWRGKLRLNIFSGRKVKANPGTELSSDLIFFYIHNKLKRPYK